MKTIARVVIVWVALMWLATPLALAYELGWGYVGDWFLFATPDKTNWEIARIAIARITICLTAVYVEFSALRILLGRAEISGWRKTRLLFNILFAVIWLSVGSVVALFVGHYIFGSGIYPLYIPCVTPLATGMFFIAKAIHF